MNRVDTASAESRRVRLFFGGLLAIVGTLNVVEALIAHHPLRTQVLDSLVPVDITLSGRTGTVIDGLVLLLLAAGVARGKRAAWQLTIVALGTSILLNLIKDLDVEEAVLAAWVASGLWWMRHHFRAASDPASFKRGVGFLLAGAGFSVLYGVVGLWLLRDEIRPGFAVPQAVDNLIRALVQESGPYDGMTDRAAWFLNSLPWIAYGMVVLGLALILRPVVAPASGSGERERLRRTIERWGHNPVCHLALYGPTSYFWVGDYCVAYSVRGTTALALGDPIAPTDEVAFVVREFMRFCDEQGWTSAFYQVEDPGPYRSLGFRSVAIGSDAVIRCATFDLRGRLRAALRQALHHCDRHGITYQFVPGPQALAEAEQQMLEVSGRWLRSGKGPELGFSLGRLSTLRDPAIIVGLAYNAQGVLDAFVSWLPAPARKGWTLDLMRRRPEGVAHVMEALIVRSIEEAARRGLAEVSLGLAPLALEPSRSGTLADRALRDLYARLDRFRRSHSLRRFKSKFDPTWEARYLAVPTTVALPEVLFALLRAHLPPTSALVVRLRAMLPARRGGGHSRLVGT